jgi:hypothetical protein
MLLSAATVTEQGAARTAVGEHSAVLSHLSVAPLPAVRDTSGDEQRCIFRDGLLHRSPTTRHGVSSVPSLARETARDLVPENRARATLYDLRLLLTV